jgi:hypothetical protein
MTILLKMHFYAGTPRSFQRITGIPLLRRWAYGKIWGLAIESLGAGRRRSSQNPANWRLCPAGRGRGKGLWVLGARFSGLLGAEASLARSCGGDNRCQPRYALLRRSGATTAAKGERRASMGARRGTGVLGGFGEWHRTGSRGGGHGGPAAGGQLLGAGSACARTGSGFL